MRNKIIAILLLGILLLSFVSCGANEAAEPQSKTDNRTQIDKARDKIVEITEAFLNYELTASETRDKLYLIIIPNLEGTGDETLIEDKKSITTSLTNIISGHYSASSAIPNNISISELSDYLENNGSKDNLDGVDLVDIKNKVDEMRNKDYNN